MVLRTLLRRSICPQCQTIFLRSPRPGRFHPHQAPPLGLSSIPTILQSLQMRCASTKRPKKRKKRANNDAAPDLPLDPFLSQFTEAAPAASSLLPSAAFERPPSEKPPPKVPSKRPKSQSSDTPGWEDVNPKRDRNARRPPKQRRVPKEKQEPNEIQTQAEKQVPGKKREASERQKARERQEAKEEHEAKEKQALKVREAQKNRQAVFEPVFSHFVPPRPGGPKPDINHSDIAQTSKIHSTSKDTAPLPLDSLEQTTRPEQILGHPEQTLAGPDQAITSSDQTTSPEQTSTSSPEQTSTSSPEQTSTSSPEQTSTSPDQTSTNPDQTAVLQKTAVPKKTTPLKPRVWERTGPYLSASADIDAVTLGKPARALIVKGLKEPPIDQEEKAKKARAKKVKAAKEKIKKERAKKEKEKAEAEEGVSAVKDLDSPEVRLKEADNVIIHEEGLLPLQEDEPSTVDTMMAQSQMKVTDEDIFVNMNQLRPAKEATELSPDDYNDMFNMIHKGFTRNQIEKYIDDFPTQGQDPSQNPPWIVSFPQYAPDTKNIARDVEQSRRSPHALSKKDALVIHIMTDLWDLTLPGSQDGYLDIRLRDAEFGLLVVGTQRALRFMARFYLTEGGRIEAFPEAKTIRVVASKKKAYRILEELNSLLADTDCKKIPLREVPKTAAFDKMVTELGRLTNTHIRHDFKKKELWVHWINLSDRPKHLENLRDTVYRFLLSSFYKWPGSSSRLAFWPGETSQVLGHHFLEIEHDRLRWAWHRRLGRWVRWVREIPAENVKENASNPEPPQQLPISKDILVEGWGLEPGVAAETHTSSGWSTSLHSSTQASFGHVLVPKTTQTLEPPMPGYEPHPNPRLLSPVTPPIQSLVGLEYPVGFDNATLLLRFIPRQNKKSNTSNLVDAPPLELRLRVDGADIGDAISLRAILADITTDILFPSAVVDARVFQNRYAEFNSSALGSHKEVQKFLSVCQFNRGRGTMATPSAAHFPIPRRLFVDPKQVADSGTQNADSAKAQATASTEDELVDVEYIFAGMEVQRSIESMWRPGIQLQYTSIEGGKGGGHRAEFGLVPSPIRQDLSLDAPARPKDIKAEFLRQIYDIANGKAFSWLATPEL